MTSGEDKTKPEKKDGDVRISILLILVFAGLFCHGLWKVYLTWRQPGYVEIPALVEDVREHRHQTMRSGTTQVKVHVTWNYSYTYEGTAYTDSFKLQYGYKELMEQYPRGATMPVYADPRFPGISRMDNERSIGMLILYLFEMGAGAMLLYGTFLLLRDRYQPTFSALADALASPHPVRGLRLSREELDEVPTELLSLISLKQLNLYGNRLSTLPDHFADLENLRELDLSGNRFRTVPPVLARLKNLKKLRLNFNPLDAEALAVLDQLLPQVTVDHDPPYEGTRAFSMEDAFEEADLVTVLDLRYKELKTIPAEVGNLVWLRELYLDGNRLTRLPKTLKNLTRLKVLSLGSNPLKQVPPVVAELSSLETLNLRYTQLEAVRHLPKSLQRLDLGENRITAIGRAFDHLELVFLDLDENPFTQDPLPDLKRQFPKAELKCIRQPPPDKEAEVKARLAAMEAERDAAIKAAEEEARRAREEAEAVMQAELARVKKEQAEALAELERAQAEAEAEAAARANRPQPDLTPEQQVQVAELEARARREVEALEREIREREEEQKPDPKPEASAPTISPIDAAIKGEGAVPLRSALEILEEDQRKRNE